MLKSVCGVDLVPFGWSGKQAASSGVQGPLQVCTYWLNSRAVSLTCTKLALGSECLCYLQVPYITQVRMKVINFSLSFISLYFTELGCFERALAYSSGQWVDSPYLCTWVLWAFDKSLISAQKRGVRTVVCRIWFHFTEVFMGGSHLPCSISPAWRILSMSKHRVGSVGLTMLVWVTSCLWHFQNQNAWNNSSNHKMWLN